MRKFENIVQDDLAPKTTSLWIKDNVLHFFNNGEWKPIGGDTEELKTAIKNIIYNDSEVIDSLQEIEEFLKGVDNGESLIALLNDFPIRKGTGENSAVVNDFSSNKASGIASYAEGRSNEAKGNTSHAEGFGNKANGKYSHAEGYHTQTTQDGEHAEGQYNQSNEDTLSSVGNGVDNNRHNAIEVKKDGTILVSNTYGEGEYYEKPMMSLQEELLSKVATIPLADIDDLDTSMISLALLKYKDVEQTVQYLNDNNINGILTTQELEDNEYITKISKNKENYFVYEVSDAITSLNQVTTKTLSDIAIVGCPKLSLALITTQQPNLEYINVRYFTGSNFYGANKFQNNLYIKKVIMPNAPFNTGVNYMFDGCTNLEEVYNTPDMVGSFTYGYFFRNCSNLRYVEPFSVNTSEKGNYYISWMFSGCSNLINWPFKGTISTSQIGNVFRNLKQVLFDVPYPIEASTGNTGYLFYDSPLSGKVKLIVRSNNYSKDITSYASFGNTNIEEAHSEHAVSGTWYIDALFTGCKYLKKATIIGCTPGKALSYPIKNVFAGCSELRYIDMPGLGDPMDFSPCPWGEETEDSNGENRQSLIDTLLNNSYDNSSSSEPITITLSETTMNILTEEEKEAITAKGYTLVQG